MTDRSKSRDLPDEAYWLGEPINGGLCGINSDINVTIVQGQWRSMSYSEPLTDGDPEWVTVLVASFLDESWINVVRYTLFGIRE